MAKKSSKGKDKKLARKAENERAAAVAASVKALNEASASGDLLAAQYPAFTRYDRKGLAAALRFYSAPELPPALLDWALGLTRDHMAALYEACPGWGWSDAKKRAELADPAARYLVVFEQQQQQQQQAGGEAAGALQAAGGAAAAAGAAPAAAPAPAPLTLGAGAAALEVPAAVCTAEDQPENLAAAGNNPGSSGSTQAAPGSSGDGCLPGRPVAFLHFRFEVEEGEAVLYCYEIQVAAAAQGKGLGRFLMQLLELVGRRSGVARLMLTVFHANTAALALYKRLGYVLDDDSPGAVDPSGDHKYEILTKRLPPPAAAKA